MDCKSPKTGVGINTLIVGKRLDKYLAKCHEAFRTGLRAYGASAYGEGYEGYHGPASIQDLVAGNKYDVVFADYDMNFKFPSLSGMDGTDIDAMKVVNLADYWSILKPNVKERFLEFLDKNHIQFMISFFPGSVHGLLDTKWLNRTYIVLPTFDPTIFRDWKEEKVYDVGFLADGQTYNHPTYPERSRIHRKLLEASEKGLFTYFWDNHPGWGEHPLSSPRVGEGFSRAINRCKIFITTSGIHKHPNPKYLEILASGTVLLADTPDDRGYLRLNSGSQYINLCEHDVVDTIVDLLKSPDRLRYVATEGWKVAQKHNCYERARRFMEIAIHERENCF